MLVALLAERERGLVDGHPAQGMIEHAVANRMADARPGGAFDPDAAITRGELADYLVTGNAVRQFRPTDGSDSLFDVSGVVLAAAEAVTASGGSLRS
jgi:serine protease AprX